MRAQTPGDIVIIARTDALQSLGYEAAVQRLKRAIETGADVAFLEGLTSHEQLRSVCRDLAPTPVLLNMVSGGVTPDLNAEEARKLGFRIIIFPGLAVLPVYRAVSEAARELKSTGTVKSPKSSQETPRQMYDVVGMKECMAFDMASGGVSFSRDI